MTRRLAVIPARGGSKRIVAKNIRGFCGKPIIAYTLETIRNCDLFDVVHVSTDCEEISAVVTELGYEPDFIRPDELADDHAPIMPVLKYVTEEYVKRGQQFDQVWLLTPTSAFLEVSDLKEASNLFDASAGLKPVLAVSEYQAPIEWAFNRSIDGALDPVQPGMFAIRSQDLTAKYFDVGSFALFPSRYVLESEGVGSDDSFIGQVLPKYKAIDIDTLEDWKLAEALYYGLNSCDIDVV